MEIGDFYDAKGHYIDSLINRAYVNHRIRKEALLRLMFINKRIPKEIGAPKDSPEKILVSRYFISQKYVQVILDTSSFSNTKTLKSTMNLPKMIFNELDGHDFFGLKILKNGYNPDYIANMSNEKKEA